MQFSFDGRTVLVTGAAHGFGRAIALAFARLGANVYGGDVLEEPLQETERLGRETGNLTTGKLDVTDRDAVGTFVERAVTDTSRIDVLVNNAGGVLGQTGRPLEEVPELDWHAIFGVNLDGAFWMSQAAAPYLKQTREQGGDNQSGAKQGGGRIVNISSGAGLGVSLTGIQAYAAAKAGLIGLTRQLAHELGPWGVTVNCIAPGFVRSNPTTERQWQAYGQEGQEKLLQNIALRRLGTPEDIASGVLFFASDMAGWVTGQTLSVDGGR